MPFNYNREVIDLIESSVRNFKALPLNLGAIPGSGGGEGAPPGGYIGWLPQTRVAYDIDEAATLVTSVSGSILDNLNHIRYRLNVIESGGASSGIMITDENNSVFYPSTLDLHFVGSGVVVTDLGGGDVRIRIDATGSGSGVSTFLGLTDTPNSYAGQTGKLVAVNSGETALEFIAPGISDAPSDGTTYGRRNAAWIAVSGGSGGIPLTVEDYDGSPTVTNVDKIVFSGAVITDLGSGDVLVAFSGTSAEQVLHYYNDDLTSQISLTTFTTSKVYASGTLRVYYNGVRQRKGIHYVDDVSFTTFSTYFTTYSGDSMVVDYDYFLSQQATTSPYALLDVDGTLVTDSDGNQLTESL